MKTQNKLFALITLVVLATLVFVPTAYAFDGRGGDKILIPADEVVNEDLYIGATDVIIDGTINGDLMAGGETVVINGTVTGDLFVSGSNVLINGTVGDDVFAAAASVTLGSSANIADDVFSTGASVELRAGSQVGGSLMVGAGQGLIAGAIAENLNAGVGSLRLEGVVNGDATLFVNGSETNYMPTYVFGDWEVQMESIPGGLSFGPEAKVAGTLEYTSPETVSAASQVAAQVKHNLPPMDEQIATEISRQNTTSNYIFDQIRRLVSLLFVGLLIAWLAPRWIKLPAEIVQTRLLPSLGLGVVSAVAAPFLFMTALGVVILVAVVFGLLSLFQMTALTLLTGFPLLGLVFIGFIIVVSYLCQAVIAYLTGRWILGKVRPEWNAKIYWPLLLGLVLYGLLFAIPIAGVVLQILVVIAGLGAVTLVLLGTRPEPAAAPVAVEAI